VLAGTSRLNEVKIFDIKNNDLNCSTLRLEMPIFSCSFANRSNMFAFAGGFSEIFVMDVIDS